MNSIRRSLIVYFLLLATGALGAVSWFSYTTTAYSLRDRQNDERAMIEKICETNCKNVRADLDQHLLAQARRMAGLLLVTEKLDWYYPASAVGTAIDPLSAANQLWTQAVYPPKVENPGMRLYVRHPWLYPAVAVGGRDPLSVASLLATRLAAFNPPLVLRPFVHSFLQSAEALVTDSGHEGPHEYFQVYGNNGQPMQRSKSMGEHVFTLDNQPSWFAEQFDDIALAPEVKVRRVTLKTPVLKRNFPGVFFWPRLDGPGPGRNPRQPGFKGGMRPPLPPRDTPALYIQYAGDLEPVDAKIHEFQQQRDEQVADLDRAITNKLQRLRDRMLWIALATFAALWIGGLAVIHLGLAPLAKMSDAVSQVSAKNFHLPLDAATLPDELQPIARRLVEALEELRKAFAREKQAAADISHELRTPLAALMTTLDVGLRKTRTSAEYRELLEECRGSGQHMYHLVERLLTLARLDAGADQYRPTQVDAIDVALQCADLIRPLARARSLDVRLNVPDPVMLQTDPDKLREVIVNLMHNAVEYNKPHGSIELSVERTNGHARIEVRDTGIGIRPEVQAHIFERFYRADPSRHADTPHAGLGLAIVKSYVDLMGGTIQVASSDAGTVFAVDLPAAEPMPALATAIQNGSPVLSER